MGRTALNFWSTAAHGILMMLAGWIHREQEAVVAYQKEEIRALREMLGGKRLSFSDAQRRRLALKARPLSHAERGPGRPPKPQHIRDLVLRLAHENVR